MPRPIVIAHRGAAGYLPEHTLAGKAYAHAAGVDYLEQDVVLTRDDVPVVFHDLVLDAVTDAAEAYPDRARADGHRYVVDFSYAELGRLRVRERVTAAGGPAWPQRFVARDVPFRINSLAEELAFVRALNAATGRDVGVYAEVKSPAWHRAQGKDPSPLVLAALAAHGYRERSDHAYVQCFDAVELRRLREELGCRLRLVQLIGENAWGESDTDYAQLREPAGLREVARYADAIGPWIPHVARWPASGPAEVTPLVARAHAVGLAVHPYTLRADQLPGNARDIDAAHHVLFDVAAVDGLFTDFPDLTVQWLRTRP